MQKKTSLIELLAPAKNFDFGKSAINSGADAVYIGAPKFGARSAAYNSIGSIEQLVKYAHKYHSKVYTALNTLLYEHELDEARKLIIQLYDSGVDAIIIQDMGILEMDLPPIPLFASTQTHNTQWEKVQFLEKNGIQRVILARELSLEQIKEISKRTTVELESFIHGAICMCYSGQCYLSHSFAGKSGNRGECIQPCRWEYSLVNENNKVLLTNKHLLSPKDLNQDNHLQSLIDAGITSFKIEGRLKDITYVKNITAWYRRRLDQILESNHGLKRSSSGKSYLSFDPNPEKSFNRGFTDYFIKGRQTNIASFNSPKSTGMPVAEVKRVEANSIIIKYQQKINNGDGLCFYNNNQLEGFRVNKAEENVLFPAEMPDVKPGTLLYRNHDQQFETFLERNEAIRKIGISLTLEELDNQLIIHTVDEDHISAILKRDFDKQVARNPEKAKNNLIQNLTKTGQSIFEIKTLNIQLDKDYFFTASFINELRRKVLENLVQQRIAEYPRKTINRQNIFYDYPVNTLDYRANVVNSLSRLFYSKRGVSTIEPGFELLKETKEKALMTTRYCLKYESGNCPKFQKPSNKDWQKKLFLQNSKNKLSLEFNCENCEMNVFREI